MAGAFAALGCNAYAAEVVISVKNQTMTLLVGKVRKAEYPISTSKFGLGDDFRSFRTPTGTFAIERKVGADLPVGAVLKRPAIYR